MTLKVIPPKRAFSLAQTHQPIAWQGFRWWADYPTEISFDDPKKVILDAMGKPPVAYYWVRTDGERYYYIGYGIFHLLDWSPFPGNLLPGEEHKLDFEGILVRAPYYLPHCRPKDGVDVITVCHHELKSFSCPRIWPVISIQYGGHGIQANNADVESTNSLAIKDWRLLPFDPLMADAKRREIIRQNFGNNGVNLPDCWAHHGEYKGWFWNRPDELFAAMLK